MAAQSPLPADPTIDDQMNDRMIKLLMVLGMAEDAAAFWRQWLVTAPLDVELDREHIETARAQFEMIVRVIKQPLRDDGQ